MSVRIAVQGSKPLPKKKGARTVFGRLKAVVGEETFKFEMTLEGIRVRKAHCRGVRIVPFSHLAGVAGRQQAELFPEIGRSK